MPVRIILKITLIAILLFMIWEIVDTSMESSLFKEWSALGDIPWMEATLFDFYANVFCIYLWIFYKEKNIALKIFWLAFLITLGSVATCIYLLRELFRLKDNESFNVLFVRQNP